MMLVGMVIAFLSLFLINSTKLQTCTLKLETLEFNTWVIPRYGHYIQRLKLTF